MNALHPARAQGSRVARISSVVVMALVVVVVMPMVSMVSASADTAGQGAGESAIGSTTSSVSMTPTYLWALLGLVAIVVGLLVAGRHASSGGRAGDRGTSAPAGSIG